MTTALELQHFAVLSVAFYHFPISLYLTSISNNPCHLTCYYTDNEPVRHATSRVVRGLALPWGAYWCFSGWKTIEQLEPGDTLDHTFYFPEWPKCSLIGSPWTDDFAEDLAKLYEPWGSHLHEYNLWFIIADPEAPVITFPDENLHMDFFGCHHAGVQWIETDGYLPLEGPDKAPCYFYGDTLELISPGHWSSIVYGFFCKGNGEDMLLYLTLTKKEFSIFPNDSGFFIERGIHVGYQHIETGPVKFNLLDLWKATRTHFGLDTNYENWYISQYEIACRDPVPALPSSIKNAVFALYYPPPKPPVLRWFTFRGTIQDELSPSVTALMSHCHPGATPLQKFEFYDHPRPTYSNIYEPNRSGQTFTPTEAHLLTKVYTFIHRVSGTYPTLNIEIREAPDDTPTGPVLSSGHTPWALIPEWPDPAWVETEMSFFIPKPGTKYAIIAHTSFVGQGIIRWWRRSVDATYPRGIRIYSTNSGNTWSKFPTQDFLFQEWGIPPKGDL